MRRFCILLAAVAVLSGAWFASAEERTTTPKKSKVVPVKAEQNVPSDQLRMDSALVTLIEQVEIPAKDVGVLEKIKVAEGDLVTEGDLIAQIEDKDAQLTRNKARIEADIAREEAANDTKVRSARKTADVALSELGRAKDSIEKYSKSVPAAELDRLLLTHERSVIDVEQADHELKAHQLTHQLKENEVALAEHNVAKRQIKAPLAGMVVQVHKHVGEWVQPGDKVVRVLRLNRLRVESFLTRSDVEAQGVLVGRPVRLSVLIAGKPCEFTGKLVFVHPEINPLNGQVRVWAEVENRDLTLKPGMQGSLTVLPPNPAVATAK